MKKYLSIFFIIIFTMTYYNCGDDGESQFDDAEYIFIGDNLIKVKLYETDEAFPNPMKGFRPAWSNNYIDLTMTCFASVYKHYIGYSNLENNAEDTAKRIIDWSNNAWKNIEEKNIKVIPRVVLTSPISNEMGAPTDDYWPNDILQPSHVLRWETAELKNRLVSFIYKLGEAWDNDPRVAAIELGLWGYWGEHHLLYDGGQIPIDFQQALGEAAALAFKNKKIMIRYPDTFKNFRFGFYWDSFALPDDNYNGEGIITRNVWKDQMISGEVAYDWGDQSYLGASPDDTLRNDHMTNNLINWIKRTNASSLGWISAYTKSDITLSKNADRIQKILGYRYIINSAIYNHRLNPGEEISLELDIINIGSAPFYYKWPVQLFLLNLNRQVVWNEIVDADIRQWLPNEANIVKIKANLPASLMTNNYIIAISILDPSGNLPSLRFANINYYSGGITPLGIIGIGQDPVYYTLRPFASLKNDNTLRYEKSLH